MATKGTVVLLGIPEKYFKRAKNELAKCQELADWTFEYVPTEASSAQIPAKVLRRLQQAVSDSAAIHIFGLSLQQNRQELTVEIRKCFRFRWFDHTLLGSLASQDPQPFLSRLILDLNEEALWAERVKPSDLKSPLLLPECCFDAGRHGDLWRKATAYGDLENVNGAEKAVDAFRSEWLRKNDGGPGYSRWIDKHGRIFDHRAERHADAPFPRDRKYSYRLESGFHYDVSSDRGEFSLNDVNGSRHRVSRGHMNVDPHGYVR